MRPGGLGIEIASMFAKVGLDGDIRELRTRDRGSTAPTVVKMSERISSILQNYKEGHGEIGEEGSEQNADWTLTRRYAALTALSLLIGPRRPAAGHWGG